MKKLNIPGRCYVVAEIGGNFLTYPEAVALIDAASDCGADAVKLQTYRGDKIASRNAMFDMENTGLLSQYDFFRKYALSEELHRQVFDYANAKGLDVFTTPSHVTDLPMLERLGCCAYKIGSDDAVNLPFLREVAKLRKPVILATGMCTMEEVRRSVAVILGEGNRRLVLLHAVTAYPTHPEDVNLSAMQALQKAFPGLPIGYSDHTIGALASVAAAVMGARIVEKHFTLDKNADGPDHMLSADPKELLEIVHQIRTFEAMRGNGLKMPAAGESVTRRNNRKSVVVIKKLCAGDILNRENIDIKRPGFGIQPCHFEELFGRRIRRDMDEDEVLTWEDLG